MECFGKYFRKKRVSPVKPRENYDLTIQINKAENELKKCAQFEEKVSVSLKEKADLALSEGRLTDATLYAEKSAESKVRSQQYHHLITKVEIGDAERKAVEIQKKVAEQLGKVTNILDNTGERKRLQKVAKKFEKLEKCLENSHLSALAVDSVMGISPPRPKRHRSHSAGDTLDMEETFFSAPTYDIAQSDYELDQRLREHRK